MGFRSVFENDCITKTVKKCKLKDEESVAMPIRRNRLLTLILISAMVVLSISGFGKFATTQVDAAVLRTVTCSTATEIINALKNARPGDRIVIRPGTYTGSVSASGNGAFFYSGANGTSANHIIIESESASNPAILQGTGTASNYTLYITGDYWEIKNLKIATAQKGLMLDHANYCYISNCEIYNVGMEALHFRDGSSNNLAENLNIHDTGKNTPAYGEGVYVGSDKGKWSTYNMECNNNIVRNSVIGPGVTAEHVDIKEGTTGTVIEGCAFRGTGMSGQNYADSFVDVKGNNAQIRNNIGYRENNSIIVDAFQLSQQVAGWGLNNSFTGNTLYLDNSTAYVINAGSGTSATAANNTRNPSGNMYRGNVTVITTTPTPTRAATPTPGSKVLPGRIEAENYNAMSGIDTETTGDTGGGLNVGWIDTGDWMDYNVNVQTGGNYRIDYRVASPNTTGKVDFRIGGATLALTAIPNTGGWQAWTTVSANVSLNAGSQTIRLLASGGGWNINWFSATAMGATPTPTRAATATPNPTGTATVTPIPTRTGNPTPTPPPGGIQSWQPGTAYATGSLVTYGGKTYKCLQAHTSIVSWEPPNVPALWQEQ